MFTKTKPTANPTDSLAASMTAMPPLEVGVSACLLGQKVRFDGQHKRDGYLVDVLGQVVQWVPVCPEVEVGMPIPRPTLRLVQLKNANRGPHMIDPAGGIDWTDKMHLFVKRRVNQLLSDHELSGYVLKSKSPSCGMERVRVYAEGRSGQDVGAPRKDGVGLFAQELLTRAPHLPVEEEGRLVDPGIRENFIERLFAYQALQTLWRSPWRLRDLLAFHTAHKLSLLAHEPAAYSELGRLLANAKGVPRGALKTSYEDRFMVGMKKRATRGRHCNVLSHMAGYFRGRIAEPERREINGLIEEYRAGLLPLIVPVTLLRHHAERHGEAYLQGQTYLCPHPNERLLRNRV